MTDLSAFELGEKSGRTFRESVEEQLSAIAVKFGVNVASSGDGGASEYGRGVGPCSRGIGTGRSRLGSSSIRLPSL
jgi:hypothetical protein